MHQPRKKGRVYKMTFCQELQQWWLQKGNTRRGIRTMARLAENFEWTASLDFGAFDGSLGETIRNEVEKSVLNSLLGHLIGACEFTEAALRDRNKEKFHAAQGQECARSMRPCPVLVRPSGKRGGGWKTAQAAAHPKKLCAPFVNVLVRHLVRDLCSPRHSTYVGLQVPQ